MSVRSAGSRRWAVFAVALAIAGVAAGLAAAGVGSWGPARGPFGGSVGTLLVDPQTPSTLYAAADGGGIFKSTDAGADWARIGFPGFSIDALVQAPSAPQTLYAAVFLNGLWKSTDGGATWQRTGLSRNADVASMAVDPTNPQVVYVGMRSFSDLHGLYKTVDGGVSWTQAGIKDQPELNPLAIDPTNPSLIYAVSGSSSLLASHDAGATWSRLTTPASTIFAFAIDPAHSGTLYIADDGGQLFGTTDGGVTWRPLAKASLILSLLVDPRNGQTLYAGTESGALESTDGGATFQAIGPAGETVHTIVPDPSTGQRLFVGSGRGVLRTDDNGAHWTLIVNGMIATNIGSLAIDPRRPRTVYAGGGRLFESTDGAQNWADIGPQGKFVTTVALGPKTVLAGGDGLSTSGDGGKTWSAPALKDELVTSIAASTKSRVVYAGTFEHGLFVSSNAGRSWRQTGLQGQWVIAAAASPADPRDVIASTLVNRKTKIVKSTNGGRTWQAVRLPTASTEFVTGFTVDPRNPKVVYVAGIAAVYKGTFAGKSLTPLGRFPGEAFGATGVAVDPAHAGVMYAGTLLDGIFRSANGGRTWQRFDKGLTNDSIGALVIDSTGRVLYAGTSGGGVFDYRFR